MRTEATIEMDREVLGILRRGFYSTAFQPIVHNDSMKTVAFEALMRGPEGTCMSQPGKLFNENGLLSNETLKVLDAACINSAVRTSHMLPKETNVFINITSVTLQAMHGNGHKIMRLFDDVGLKKDRVVFELSERTHASECPRILEVIDVLRKEGFRIALDDIGLRSPYLYQYLMFNPEFVKVDRFFTSGIDRDEKKQEMMHCLKYMAGRFGASLVAEGVETASEYETLKQLGICFSQGYFWSRALEAEAWRDGTGGRA